MVPSELMSTPQYRASTYALTCSINNTSCLDCPIYDGINDSPICAVVPNALAELTPKGQ